MQCHAMRCDAGLGPSTCRAASGTRKGRNEGEERERGGREKKGDGQTQRECAAQVA